MRRSILICVLALLLVLPNLAAAGGPIDWVKAYDPAAGELPEGIAIDKVGNIFVSMSPIGQVRKIGRDGAEKLFYQFDEGAGLAGLAVDAPGNVYVCVILGGPGQLQGVWRIARNGSSASRLPGTENVFLANGIAFADDGYLYITGSYVPGSMPPAGAIWRVGPAGEAEIWLQDSELLGGLGQIPNYPPLGANGIAFFDDALYVANTEKGLVVRVPVLADGSAGEPAIVAQTGLYLIDGIALDVHGGIYAALIGQNRIVKVDPANGSVVELVGAAAGVDGPASLAFGTGKGERKTLYFTNYAALSPEPHPGLLKMDVGVPGLPLP